jgi:hypothetical protein
VKLRNIIILLTIFALLGGYVYFFELGERPEEKPKAVKIWDISSEDVVSVSVSGEEGKALLIREGNGPWLIKEPIEEEADQTRVKGIVNRLGGLTAKRIVLEKAEDLSIFGLEEPELEVRVRLSDGREEVLLIGDKNPQKIAYYAQRLGEERIYLIYSGIVDDLKRLITEPPKKPTPTPTRKPTPSPAE